ncbi:hypothetical protein GT347_01325 [Xylophilus rhododendri]|uniref:Zona occludens toxin N-terminal domain-containing protein n=1 Tax=Xylophilus rhododendri TaxID=2697032 RepID=A0A857IYU1_9BURK|nr:zonular occludens toxin domain-containing protein [Xylophilus rhododendri]QHI96750.1 hypothetical protein GT347_01325 [Xylophilus rhododendri]
MIRHRAAPRAKQRGFLYVVTGANGTGKTLNTLKWVRERQLKENRPVAYNGRFDMVEGGELASWKKIDAKDWQSEPDGTIFLIDEAHNDFPTRGAGTPPDHVAKLAEHRKRGFDFYLITQHPNNIDAFVRRLVGSPGWHRHLKRNFGRDMVSVLEWSAVNGTCEKDGSGKSAQVTIQAFPKEVYGWYRSAVLHTGKKTIPRAVYVLAACALLVPALIWYGAHRVMAIGDKAKPDQAQRQAQQQPSAMPVPAAAPPAAGGAAKVLTSAEYADQFRPRIVGLAHTAPAYDQITQPTAAPVPAACVESEKQGCKCYTQQGTPYATTVDICRQVVSSGFFMAFDPKGAPASAAVPVKAVQQPQPALQRVQTPLAYAAPAQSAQAQPQGTQEPLKNTETLTRVGRYPTLGAMGADFNLPPIEQEDVDGQWHPPAGWATGPIAPRTRYSTIGDVVRAFGG